jgi:hypothetical protein
LFNDVPAVIIRTTMGSHPVNLAVRFVLELSALVAMGFWGWHQGDGGVRIALGVGIPLLAAAVWGTLAVPGDPSRSGSAPLPVPGVLRLVIELVFFSFATWVLYHMGAARLSALLGVVVALHYVASYDRIQWLLAR